VTLSDIEQALLRLTKAKRSALDLTTHIADFAQANNRPVTELRDQATADRLSLAQSFIAAAEVLMTANPPMYRDAISRYYYAMYHTMRAVVYSTHGGDDHQEHAALPSHTPPDFPSSAVWRNTLKDARGRRNEADYDPYPSSPQAWQDIAADLRTKATQLVVISRAYLRGKGCRFV
jgi:uncharacterized protein (UPF0332 family)